MYFNVLNFKVFFYFKQTENNNVIGFENLNLNNNRRGLASAESCEFVAFNRVIESFVELVRVKYVAGFVMVEFCRRYYYDDERQVYQLFTFADDDL